MILDGPMGTALTLPPAQAARAALTHPRDVRAVHARYVAAGAQAVLTHTTGLPYAIAHGEPHAEAWLAAALACTENLGAQVWIALGPGEVPHRVLTWAATAAREGRARGVWFETWSAADAEILRTATAACQTMRLEYVVTFLPQPTTPALFAQHHDALAVGLNCGLPFLHTLDARALLDAPLPPGQKRVLKPAAAFADERLSPADIVTLTAGADWVGVCCGGTEAHVRALAEHAA